MESFYKNRLLFWVLMFLIVVNLAALATYFLIPKKAAVVTCGNESMAPGCLLHAELDLTEDQIRLVDRINAEYQEGSQPVSNKIKSLRAEILDELSSDAPDTLVIDRISQEISQLQSQLHRENIRHYLELKKVCTPDQAMRLSSLYRDIYGCPMHEKENGGQPGHRHKGM